MKIAFVSPWSEIRHTMRHGWHILRQVLRGYLKGQPPDDERPQKGCC